MRWIKDILKNLIIKLTLDANPERVTEIIQQQLDDFKSQMNGYKNPNGKSFSASAHDYYQNILPYLIEALEELLKEQSTYQKEVLIEKIKPLN